MTRPVTNPSDGWQPAAASTNRTQPTPAIDKCREAEKVRREHVRSWLATAKPDPAILRWTLGELLRGVGVPHDIVAMKWAADVLRGSHPTKVNTHATGPRASIGALALVLADRELATSVESWSGPIRNATSVRSR